MRHNESSTGTAGRGPQQDRTVPHPEFLVDALLENSYTRPAARKAEFVISGMAHCMALAAALLLPLYLTEGINIDRTFATPLVGPPTPLTVAAKPIPAVAPLSIVPPKVLTSAIRLPIPKLPSEKGEPAAPGLIAGVVPGLPATSGGQLDGVIGGIRSDSVPSYVPPPPPAKLAPKAAIPVGGDIREPKLVSVVDPVYPRVLRRTGVSGDVVIDAVVDTNGDVAQIRPISGQRLLLLAAMDAVRHWKYQPTLLNGQPIPVIVRVTVTFRLTPVSP